ncbi:MAG: CPBP family intramembrane metalloprotease [Planctomycetes bacterium]|nr:CPBP family intramembrane metalloprotease [Planctomycetota bacterium]
MITSEIITKFIILAGVLLFGYWLLKTSLGRKALTDSRPRRNNMPMYLCLIPPFILFGPLPLAMLITEALAADLQDWQRAVLGNLIYCIGAIVVITVILFMVRASFARRLKGFGLNIRSIHKDFFAAFVNLLAVWPLIMAAITLTMLIGKYVFGPEYQISQHEQLELITAYPRWQLRILVFIVAVVMAPVLEEMIFRGLFQTVIRSFFESRDSKLKIQSRVWLSIFISAGLFSMVHGNVQHWPALFLLGVCLGYAYEKSGSLFRPIFIHTFFNAITIILVMLEV